MRLVKEDQMKKVMICSVSLALTACVSAQPDALKDYPDGYLCKLLTEEYITTPQEQINIYKELELRKHTCPAQTAVRNSILIF